MICTFFNYNKFCNWLFVIRSLAIILWYYICYSFGMEENKCLSKLTYSLANINVFYIKLFQALSTNTFLFTSSQISLMTKYTENVPYSIDDIDTGFFDTLETIGEEHPEYKVYIHSNPCKSGTVALVYEGTMNNKKVVVKVVRKNILSKIIDSLNKFDLLIRVISNIYSLNNLGVQDILNENRKLMLEQINFSNELANATRLAQNFANVEDIIVPNVYPIFTDRNANMIVMDYVEGLTIDEIDKDDTCDYANIFARFAVKCVFFDRFYHADMHPGNIRFIKCENSLFDTKNQKKIGILDFGIMGELTKEEQSAAYNSSIYITNCDWSKLAILLLDHYIEPIDIVKNMTTDIRNQLISDLIDTFSLPDWGSFSPDDLYKASLILKNYNLSIKKTFCKLELAMCISSSVHNTLGIETDFKDAMKNAINLQNSIWEY